jgi:hypothetical protein
VLLVLPVPTHTPEWNEDELFKALSAEHRRRIAILQDVEGVLMTARHWLSPLTSALVDIRANLA